MNHRLFNVSMHRSPDAPGSGGPDDLDRLLRDWHDGNTASARAGRDRLIESIATDDAPVGRVDADTSRPKPDTETNRRRPVRRPIGGGSLFSGSGLAAAALFVIVGVLAVLVLEPSPNVAFAQVVQVPEGGRLDAFAADGEVIGPCPLQGTDVEADISGPMIRVSLTQTFGNPYDMPIEAVYTFPISHRAAVDRMVMTVIAPDGDERVVVGEIKERDLARQIYEQAKDAGYVTGLLEQERPNIFTQSVANIEPGATVKVEIGYVEVLVARDGTYAFEFPTVVGPRYIPGVSTPPSSGLPEGIVPRQGLVLRGPARILPFATAKLWNEYLQRSDRGFDGQTFEDWTRIRLQESRTAADESPTSGITAASEGLSGAEYWTANRLFQALTTATRIRRPDSTRIASLVIHANGMAEYLPSTNDVEPPYASAGDVPEAFVLYHDGDRPNQGLGEINGRWFAWDMPGAVEAGGGFAEPTDQVPDADRITPMPVRPPMRAGHDIEIDVQVDTGGVPITSIEAPLHEIVETRDGPGRFAVSLAKRREIPNRDFVLRWRLKDDAITESVFTHVAEAGAPVSTEGGYLSMVLAPPARIESQEVRRRELVFVLDTSGSMRGFPMEKSKAVVAQAIEAMRDGDTFNVITFAGSTSVLWPEPRPATAENKVAAQRFIQGLHGRGGTEMMEAIRTALVQTGPGGGLKTPVELANLPADGQMVAIAANSSSIDIEDGRTWLVVREDLKIPMELPISLPTVKGDDPSFELNGRWITIDGVRRFEVATAGFVESEAPAPLRIAMFLSDGYVGNDQAIIQMIRDNSKSTRVFSLGIGNSVNRYLLDEMSREGRGAAEYVLLADGADEVVDRLAKRIQSPLLTNIEVSVDGVEAFEILPRNPQGLLPDLFDAAPIILHARYRVPEGDPVEGQVRITGETAAGRYERVIPVTFPTSKASNEVIATLWGRAKVTEVLAPHLAAVENETVATAVKNEVVALGEAYSIVTPFTSFVAVEKSRVVIGGTPMLVDIPIELPEGTDWQGFFGEDCPPVVLEKAIRFGVVVEPEGGEEAADSEMDADLGLVVGSAAVDGLKTETLSSPSKRPPTGTRRSFGRGLEQARSSKSFRSGAASRSSGRSRGRSTRGGAAAIPAPPAAQGSRGFGGGGGAGGAASGGVREGSVTQDLFFASGEDLKETSETSLEGESKAGESEEVVELEEVIAPTIDMDRLWRVLDRRLLLLGFGAPPTAVPGLPKVGLDGAPWIKDGSVEVTLRIDGGLDDERRAQLKASGLVTEGSDESSSILVGRIAIDRLFDLAELPFVRRAVPTSGK